MTASERTKGMADREIDEVVDREFEVGHLTKGELIELLGHGSASRAREARGFSGREVESAHGAPQSAMRRLDFYDPKVLLTILCK